MQILLLVVLLVSGLPLVYVSLLLNPLVFFALGPERWRQELVRLAPHRWWLASWTLVFAVALAMYLARYG